MAYPDTILQPCLIVPWPPVRGGGSWRLIGHMTCAPVDCDKLPAMYKPSCSRIVLVAALLGAGFPDLLTIPFNPALAADTSAPAEASGAAAEVLAFEKAMCERIS